MRAKTLVTVLFAVSLVVGAFAVFNMMGSNASVPARQILAANGALPAGTLLQTEDITWQPVNATKADEIVRPSGSAVEAKPGLVQEVEASVYGAVVRHTLAAGDPIRRGGIIRPG